MTSGSSMHAGRFYRSQTVVFVGSQDHKTWQNKRVITIKKIMYYVEYTMGY